MTGPAGRPARGRRDNGLDASDFVPLADLDPRVGEHVLDLLAITGIAAYLAPSTDTNPIIRSTTLPSRPTDRLWVDREQADAARAVLGEVELEDEGAEPRPGSAGPPRAGARPAGDADPDDPSDGPDVDELDVDAEWEQIVAGYDSSPSTSVPSWPAAEETGDSDGPGGLVDGRRTSGALRPDDYRPTGPPTPGPRDSVLADETDDEGYTPPPPPPLPKPSRHAVLGVAAVLVGFVLFFRPDLLGIGEDMTMVLGVIGVLGGTGLLVYRLRDGLTADDDPDDGAVV
jgi:hypothetical protein